jgi:hypothetical protein
MSFLIGLAFGMICGGIIVTLLFRLLDVFVEDMELDDMQVASNSNIYKYSVNIHSDN